MGSPLLILGLTPTVGSTNNFEFVANGFSDGITALVMLGETVPPELRTGLPKLPDIACKKFIIAPIFVSYTYIKTKNNYFLRESGLLLQFLQKIKQVSRHCETVSIG
jgi:hypothetical protein